MRTTGTRSPSSGAGATLARIRTARAGRTCPTTATGSTVPSKLAAPTRFTVSLEKLIEDKEAGLHPGAEILLTTHDEIVLECPEDDEGVLGWLVEKMRKAAGCFLRPELASEDCVEGVEGSSWGGG